MSPHRLGEPRPSEGWALLVRRRPTLRSLLASPVGWAVCWRIRAATGSRWNHVALFVSGHSVVEADWGGVLQTPVSEYLDRPDLYEVKAVPPPAGLDAAAARRFALGQVGAGCYDFRLIALMRAATLLFGLRGLSMVTGRGDDGAWQCAELVSAAMRAGGAPVATLVPGDFDPDEKDRRC